MCETIELCETSNSSETRETSEIIEACETIEKRHQRCMYVAPSIYYIRYNRLPLVVYKWSSSATEIFERTYNEPGQTRKPSEKW